MKHLLALAATSALIWTAPLAAQNSSTAPDLASAIAADYDKELEALFLDFHRNPELSYKETRTAAIIADRGDEKRCRTDPDAARGYGWLAARRR